MTKAGAQIATRLAKTKRHGGEVLPPALFGSDSDRSLPLVRQRARASFVHRVNILERIADGEYQQQVTTTGPDGKKTVTTYTPSAKDRMQAVRMLGEYGGIPTTDSDAKGAGVGDPATMTRALLGALSDPVVRRALLADPQLSGTVRLLTAEEVPALTMPGDDELEAVTAREIVIDAPE